MRNKIIILMILMMVPMSYAFNISDIRNNMIIKDNVSYKIVGYEQVHIRYDGKYTSYTRIFIENQNTIEELEREIKNILDEISEKKNKIEMLNDELKKAESNKAELEAELSVLNGEIEKLREDMKEIEARKSELELNIRDNLTLSPMQTMSIIILFAVLVGSAVIIEILAFLKGKKEGNV
ncbi:MAG: hypothetical protein QXQ40_01730 [Candidatus Aenigmatarchaeota archaeon]